MLDGRNILPHEFYVFLFLIEDGVDIDIDDDGMEPFFGILQIVDVVIDVSGEYSLQGVSIVRDLGVLVEKGEELDYLFVCF